jgi:hypothetical protein
MKTAAYFTDYQFEPKDDEIKLAAEKGFHLVRKPDIDPFVVFPDDANYCDAVVCNHPAAALRVIGEKPVLVFEYERWPTEDGRGLGTRYASKLHVFTFREGMIFHEQ